MKLSLEQIEMRTKYQKPWEIAERQINTQVNSDKVILPIIDIETEVREQVEESVNWNITSFLIRRVY